MGNVTIAASINNQTLGVGKSLSTIITVSGARYSAYKLEVGTSEMIYSLSGFSAALGLFLIKNHSAESVLQIGFSTGTAHLVLLPGEFTLFRIPATITALYLKQQTAAGDIEFFANDR